MAGKSKKYEKIRFKVSSNKVKLKKKIIEIEKLESADIDDYFDMALDEFTENIGEYNGYGEDYFEIEISRGKEKRLASIDQDYCPQCGGHAEGYWEED
jgi:hypothetical protein